MERNIDCMEDLKCISQETADELNRCLEGLSEQIDKEHELFNSVIDCLCTELAEDSAKRIYHCLVRHSESCWLTRWYWMRRLRKELDNQDRVMDCCMDLRKLKYGDETE